MIRGRIMYYIVAVAVASSLIISGCVSAPPKVSPTPTATPMPTPTQPPAEGISVEILKSPATAEAGKSFEVSWRVNSPVGKNIPHTAVHYGMESKSEPLTLASYPSLTEVQSGQIPANFSTNMVINTTGILYFRGHAIIDGNHYWSAEKMINITAAKNVTTAVTPAATPTATPTRSGY